SLKEADIKRIIGDYKTNATKFAAITSHVRDKGAEGGMHENEDALKDNPDKNKKYGDPTEGNEDKMERGKLLAFLYDEKLSNI
ncbi:18085_t:CDS:2, partial [Cetraspora pellucida]